MLRSKPVWIVSAILVFLIWLIATVPARLVLAHVSNAVPAVYAEGVSGTIWSGKAARMSLSAPGYTHELGETQWQLHPWSLLAGKLSVSLNARNGRDQVTSDASLSLGGRVSLANTELSLPASIVRSWYPVPARIDGLLSLQLKSLSVSKAVIDELDGALTWQDAQVDFSGAPVKLGSLLAKLSMGDKGACKVELSDLGGPLGVVGQVVVTQAEQKWVADVALTPKAGFDPTVANMMSQFGTRTAAGAITLRQSGNY
jgi:general secretion pathway protein N